MSLRDVTLEIYAAGDGINYPKPGNLVVVHYTVGYDPRSKKENAFVINIFYFILLRGFFRTARGLILPEIEGNLLSSSWALIK